MPNRKVFPNTFFLEQLAIFGQKILQDTYLEMAPNLFQLTRVDVRRLRFSLKVHSKFQKIPNLIFPNTSRQGLGKSFWRWKPLQTRCVLAPNFVEHHRMTSDWVFHDPIILSQVTTIQNFTMETHSTASRIDVLEILQGNVSDRKAHESKCIDRILYDKPRGSLVSNSVKSLTSRIRGGPLKRFQSPGKWKMRETIVTDLVFE